MSKKRLMITSTISILLVAILMIGSTYSIFTTQDTDEELNVYKTGVLDVTYTLSSSNVQITNSIPTSIEDSITIDPYRITVTNHGSVSYMFDVVLESTTATDQIDEQYIMTQVGKIEPKLLSVCTNHIIKEDVIIPAGGSVDIDIRVWISDTIQNTEIGKSFFAKLKIDGLAIYDDNTEIDNSILIANRTLYGTVKMGAILDNTSSEFVSSSSGIRFSNISSDTNGKGIYLRAGTENDTYPIYYYRGAVTNNNVIFANFCWKIVRTTETGGTKLIYNGTPTDGTCDNTGESSQIGTSKFNSNYNSPADVGYMVGTRYTYSSITMNPATIIFTNTSPNSSSAYYYGTSVTYSDGNYTLNNASTYTWSSDYSSLSGYYTCRTTSTRCGDVHYIVATDSSTMYTLYMSNGKLFDDVNTSFVLGSSVTDNGDGTYTLSNTTTIKKSDWYSNYNNYLNYYTCYSTSTTCSDMHYITYVNNFLMRFSNMANNYVYGNTVSYSDGTYTLSNTKSFWNWYDNYNTLNSNHYTCFSTGTTCSTVYYIYRTNSSVAYYISLTDGKIVENALSEMLIQSSNENNSTIKATIDTWYQTNLEDYTNSYLEDTVWCNDRSINTLNGWDPNGGNITSDLNFSPHNRGSSNYQPSLSCSNPNDKFTVSSGNGNGKLTYPVALLTTDEMILAGGSGYSNSNYYLYTGQYWWTLSPSLFGGTKAFVFCVYSVGQVDYYDVDVTYGVRPSISLQFGIEISDGDGTVENPYVIS